MRTLICICSRSPNPELYKCIDALYKFQVNGICDDYKICVVDSDSSDFTNYKMVESAFPDVSLYFVKNKNYEYGAWKYILDKHPDYDVYFCIQDTIIVNAHINISLVNDTTAYTFHHHSGFYMDESLKPRSMEFLRHDGINCDSIVNTPFNLAQHSIFIVNNKVMNDIFKTLTIPPIDKNASVIYERNFGLYFIIKNINTINISDYAVKYNGGRV